jgi:comEA protein
MRRKLFFLMERLEISRSERIAVSVLMILLVFSTSIWTMVQPYANYDEENYAELERIFAERSRLQKQEMESILARYEPQPHDGLYLTEAKIEAPRDTVREDSTETDQGSERTGTLININRAGEKKLQELPGIGPAYASRIVQWRDQNGDFTDKNQLLEIRGIGEKRLAKIKPLITL